MDMQKKIEKDVDLLRNLVRDIAPIINWARAEAEKQEGTEEIIDYIEHMTETSNKVLTATIPGGA